MEVGSSAATASTRSEDVRPYRRSWVDALIALIERLPGPAWLDYLLIAAVGIAAGGGILIATNSLPESGAYRFQFPVAFGIGVGCLALIRYLNTVASARLDEFAPVLGLDRPSLERLRVELTVMPAGKAIVAPIVGIAIISVSYQADSSAAEFARLPVITQAVGSTAEFLALSMMSVLVYHTIRQLRMVDRVHARARNLDLFNAARCTPSRD